MSQDNQISWDILLCYWHYIRMVLARSDNPKHACVLYYQYPDTSGFPVWKIRKSEQFYASPYGLDSSDSKMHWNFSVGWQLRILWIFSLRHSWNPRGYFLIILETASHFNKMIYIRAHIMLFSNLPWDDN